MKKYITDENTGISYTLVGDVYIPNLVSTDTNYKIGYWGRKHKEYIKQYKPAFYITLLTQCELNSYLHDVDVRATEMYDTLVKKLAKQEGITEKLKTENQKQSNLINLLIKQLKTVKNKDFKYLGSGVQTYSWTV